MSGNGDFALILLTSQKAQNASEAALSTVATLRSEHGGRLASVEASLSAIEARLTAISAGQDSHARAILRIADTQAEHTAKLTRLEGKLDGIDHGLHGVETRLLGVETMLPGIEEKLLGFEKALLGVETTLAAILAKLS